METLNSSMQFCYKPKTALKIKVFLKSKKKKDIK